ncbi:MAG: hypothetical protein AABX93_00960 [Nanoarchaeota archaeon]
MEERDNILRILSESREAIKGHDLVKLKELSNQTVHSASIASDTDSILVAVIIYSLGKIIERTEEYGSKECGSICKFSITELQKAETALKKNDEVIFKQSLESIMSFVGKTSPDLKKDVQDILRKASINKASKIYEHGISMEQTAKLLGITMFELASYSGQKGSANVPLAKTLSVKDRVNLAMEMFK